MTLSLNTIENRGKMHILKRTVNNGDQTSIVYPFCLLLYLTFVASMKIILIVL